MALCAACTKRKCYTATFDEANRLFCASASETQGCSHIVARQSEIISIPRRNLATHSTAFSRCFLQAISVAGRLRPPACVGGRLQPPAFCIVGADEVGAAVQQIQDDIRGASAPGRGGGLQSPAFVGRGLRPLASVGGSLRPPASVVGRLRPPPIARDHDPLLHSLIIALLWYLRATNSGILHAAKGAIQWLRSRKQTQV